MQLRTTNLKIEIQFFKSAITQLPITTQFICQNENLCLSLESVLKLRIKTFTSIWGLPANLWRARGQNRPFLMCLWAVNQISANLSLFPPWNFHWQEREVHGGTDRRGGSVLLSCAGFNEAIGEMEICTNSEGEQRRDVTKKDKQTKNELHLRDL